MHYRNVAIGGTFDHLHTGHELLLKTALEISDHLVIGLADGPLLGNKIVKQTIEPFDTRQKTIETYIHTHTSKHSYEIVRLTTMHGPTVVKKEFDALVVTEHTYANGEKINEIRKQNQLSPLNLIQVPLLKGPDNKIISSTRIRLGAIDRVGFPYSSLFARTIHLPQSMRTTLQKPLGTVFEGDERKLSIAAHKVKVFIENFDPISVICVGDIVSQSLKDVGFFSDTEIIDYKTQREIFKPPQDYDMTNEPSTINSEFIEIYHKKKSLITVNGEEDLLTLPAVLLAPLHSFVVYGQKDIGIIVVEVTEETKNMFRKLVEQFTV